MATLHKVEHKTDPATFCGIRLHSRRQAALTVYWHKVTCRNCLRGKPADVNTPT